MIKLFVTILLVAFTLIGCTPPPCDLDLTANTCIAPTGKLISNRNVTYHEPTKEEEEIIYNNLITQIIVDSLMNSYTGK